MRTLSSVTVSLLISFGAAAGSIEPPETIVIFGGTGNFSCRADCVAVAKDGALVGQQPVIGYGTNDIKSYNAAVAVCRALVSFGNDPTIIEKFLAHDISIGYKAPSSESRLYLLGHKRVNEVKDCR